MAEVIRWLNVELAPHQNNHGVLVDVYGEGILITGESGIGKSEAALELVKRVIGLYLMTLWKLESVITLIGTALILQDTLLNLGVLELLTLRPYLVLKALRILVLLI